APSSANLTLDVTSPNSTNIPGFGGSTSSALLKSVAVINPATGKTLDKWTSGDNKADSGVTVPSPACVTNNNGGGSGNITDLYAHFKNANSAPSTTTPAFSPSSPKTNDTLQASTTTSDAESDQVSVAWTWKVTRGANTCTIKADSSPLAAVGTRSVSLDLSLSYSTSACTGASPPSSINPSKGDVVNVAATPTDAPGLSGATQSNNVTIANSAPTVALNSAPSTANEGDTKTYTFTAGDADGDSLSFVTSYVVHWGDGSSNTYASNGVKTHTYADGPNNYAITVDLVDEDGTFLDRANPLSVHVNNVAPTVTFTSAPAAANEGQMKHYTYSISDPGADTISSVATSSDEHTSE